MAIEQLLSSSIAVLPVRRREDSVGFCTVQHVDQFFALIGGKHVHNEAVDESFLV
ncbi:hypothetical protein HJB69_22530 [Rhizobium lentis]|uniref:CBS domain-containing protein n=1 Tax=Rhizobium lentis TaxID=1138194 RepID=A0ABS7IF34_9HYPH|nr:hypothetical protein [Rhizobium lentis]MBX5037306.1 hypothetical protein [Rhizobium lentis]MBX5088079.1 hypothetical protein [Rhizobium lentis]MBX5145733.1 hypothetical protein [Rhizobium lentis]